MYVGLCLVFVCVPDPIYHSAFPPPAAAAAVAQSGAGATNPPGPVAPSDPGDPIGWFQCHTIVVSNTYVDFVKRAAAPEEK